VEKRGLNIENPGRRTGKSMEKKIKERDVEILRKKGS